MGSDSINLIIKCVGTACNIRCGYCFYHDTDQAIRKIMIDGILEKLIEDISDLDRKICTFIWHGGEPLLAGMDFFRYAVEIQKRQNFHSVFVDNHIQTNGLLLTDKWIDFFIEKACFYSGDKSGDTF